MKRGNKKERREKEYADLYFDKAGAMLLLVLIENI